MGITLTANQAMAQRAAELLWSVATSDDSTVADGRGKIYQAAETAMTESIRHAYNVDSGTIGEMIMDSVRDMISDLGPHDSADVQHGRGVYSYVAYAVEHVASKLAEPVMDYLFYAKLDAPDSITRDFVFSLPPFFVTSLVFHIREMREYAKWNGIDGTVSRILAWCDEYQNTDNSGLTADDVVTRLARAYSDDSARMLLSSLPVSMLRKVADLTYACDYPESHGKLCLLKAIMATR